MAEHLASIFGTEQDKVNCSFYYKIGACRHGERCSRLHTKPTFSQTMLLKGLYPNPKINSITGNDNLNEVEVQEHFDEFFEEVFVEVDEKYGSIEEMNICDNIGDHLLGNVYIKFHKEDNAEKAMTACNNRWFNGQPMYAELSTVTDFREACCRQYEKGNCEKGGYCNFLHLRPISRELRSRLFGRKDSRPRRSRPHGRRRSRSPESHHERRRGRYDGRSRDNHRSSCRRN